MNECRGGRDEHGNLIVANGTALHWATYYGQLEIAKLLIEKGAGMCLHNCHFAWVHPSAGKQLIENCLTDGHCNFKGGSKTTVVFLPLGLRVLQKNPRLP